MLGVGFVVDVALHRGSNEFGAHKTWLSAVLTAIGGFVVILGDFVVL